MRKILLAASALVLSTGMALAADSADVEINAEQAPLCTIIDVSTSITLGAVGAQVPGVFQYSCNFVGQPELVFTSANGGVETAENGGGLANYGIWLNDGAPVGGPGDWLQASNTPQSYPNITTSTPANATITPFFVVGLSEALPVAGAYSDILTIDITP